MFLKRFFNISHGKRMSQPKVLSFKERAKLCDYQENVINLEDYPMSSYTNQEMKDFIYDLIKTIMDPEKPYSLEELNVVYENGVEVTKGLDGTVFMINVQFKPTVAHCSLATLIGLCIRIKLKRNVLARYKLNISVKEGSHLTEDAVNKQVNDKERVAAAMENPTLQELVDKCIQDAD